MNIKSRFTSSIISKLVSLAIRKKLGYDIKLSFNEINLTIDEENAHVHLDVDADSEKGEILRLIKNIGM